VSQLPLLALRKLNPDERPQHDAHFEQRRNQRCCRSRTASINWDAAYRDLGEGKAISRTRSDIYGPIHDNGRYVFKTMDGWCRVLRPRPCVSTPM